MTNVFSEALQRYFASHTFEQLTVTTSALAIGLLLLVIVEREILRATSVKSERRNFAAFAIVVLPMAAVFIAVILARFIELSTS